MVRAIVRNIANLRWAKKNDDTGNMYEVIFRRLGERNIKSWGRPDLLLIDGGKGQLSAAIKARDERGIKLPIISIAKTRGRNYYS